MDLHQRRQLIEIVRQQFRLEWQGIHGVPHWGRQDASTGRME